VRISKDIYYTKTIPAIITQMEANRSAVKLTIFLGLKQPDADYPLIRAESDLIELSDAGSLNAAVSKITQAATTQKTQAQDEIVNRMTMSKTANSSRLRAWLQPNGVNNAANIASLQKWLDAEIDQHKPGEACLSKYNAAPIFAVANPPKKRVRPSSRHAYFASTMWVARSVATCSTVR
jgi:hypothetical protein